MAAAADPQRAGLHVFSFLSGLLEVAALTAVGGYFVRRPA
jgi:hypothetical protein